MKFKLIKEYKLIELPIELFKIFNLELDRYCKSPVIQLYEVINFKMIKIGFKRFPFIISFNFLISFVLKIDCSNF